MGCRCNAVAPSQLVLVLQLAIAMPYDGGGHMGPQSN